MIYPVKAPVMTEIECRQPALLEEHRSTVRGIGMRIDVVERHPAPPEIHIVLDNLFAHQAVKNFPTANPRVRFHFTPTYSSWLNPVENLVRRKRPPRTVLTNQAA